MRDGVRAFFHAATVHAGAKLLVAGGFLFASHVAVGWFGWHHGRNNAVESAPIAAPQPAKEPAPDLGFDLLSLTDEQAVLGFHGERAYHKVGFNRADFELMFGPVHIEPRVPKMPPCPEGPP